MPRRSAVLSLLLAACGGSSSPPAAPDGAAPPPDARIATVTVHLRALDDGTTPAAGFPVFFSNRDGSIAKLTNFDATGSATAQVEDGGSVTASFFGPFDGGVLFTVMDVHDGDDLDLTTAGIGYSQAFAQMRADYPAITVPKLVVYDDCDSTQVTKAYPYINVARCATEPLDLIAVAFDANGNATQSSEVTGVTAQDQGSVTFPAFADVTSSFHLHYDHGTGLGPINVARHLGTAFSQSATPTAADPIDLDLPDVTTGWGGQYVETRVGDTTATSRIADTVTPAQTSYSLDLATMPTQTLSFTTTDHTVAWTTSAPFTADLLYTAFLGHDASNNQVIWMIVAPPTTTSFKVPTYPVTDPNKPFALPPDPSSNRPKVELVQNAAWGAYDAHRADIAHNIVQVVGGGLPGAHAVEIYAQ